MSVTLRSFIRLIGRINLSLAFVLVVAACGRGAEEPTPTSIITPAAGGMVVPTATPDSGATATVEAVVDTLAPTVPVPDDLVIAIERVRLLADADQKSLVLNEYGEGEEFTVLAPSGDYDAYPVDLNGTSWVRLRAADGLIGWLPLSALESQRLLE